jgi:hypothetical protein
VTGGDAVLGRQSTGVMQKSHTMSMPVAKQTTVDDTNDFHLVSHSRPMCNGRVTFTSTSSAGYL